jgi:hypothetical protein
MGGEFARRNDWRDRNVCLIRGISLTRNFQKNRTFSLSDVSYQRARSMATCGHPATDYLSLDFPLELWTEMASKKANSIMLEQRKKSDRRSDDRRKQAAAVAVERRAGERREKVSRRRQIDPTTCERDYTDAEVEFMQALDDYKRKNGRMFPTCSEVLEVLMGLGYAKSTATIPREDFTPTEA